MKLHAIKTQAGRFAWRIAGLIGREFISVDMVKDVLSTMDPRQAQEAQLLLGRMGRQDHGVKRLDELKAVVREIVQLLSRGGVTTERTTSPRLRRLHRELLAGSYHILAREARHAELAGAV